MAKASAPGRAKTRLVPPLTYEQAATLNTAFLQDVTENILLAGRRAAPSTGIAGYAAYGPPDSEAFFRRTLPPSIGLFPAWLPNFGECLFHAVNEIFARGHKAAVVLDSDSPNLPTVLLNTTAELLAQPGDRAVLGPSTDGGYYLLGLKAAHRRMFEDIDWSTERVAQQTHERAREIGLDLHLLPTWYDIDDVACLRRLDDELRTSLYGGAFGCGTVFELIHNSDGSWTESNINDFTCTNGSFVGGGLVFDKAGNLYGTTGLGGTSNVGVVFQLVPNGNGTWTENVLHNFTGGSDGGYPGLGVLVFDSAGNLYGTAAGGALGDCDVNNPGCGTVFKMSPKANGTWSFKVLHSFTGGNDGGVPVFGLTFDKAGNLYSTTDVGGQYGYAGLILRTRCPFQWCVF